jgi:hypothetical protein
MAAASAAPFEGATGGEISLRYREDEQVGANKGAAGRAEASRLFDLSEHRLRSPCRIPATNCETLAGFSPQSAKPNSFAAK